MTDMVDEFVKSFDELLPLHDFLMGKGSNATPGTATSMDVDEMIDKVLTLDYELAIKRNVVRRIILHLLSGKNVVLVGAPGVGKTALAKRILDVVGRKMTGLNYEQAVATAEWTKRDIIGGLDLEQKFQKGKVTEAAEQGKWLLIDEFNRADINKAFGEMFLAIESKRIPLSEELAEAYALVSIPKGQHSITIPKNFRMVCTMNDFDKNLLLTELSFGLITRFAFVDIEPDTDKEQESVKNQVLDRFIESDIEVDEQDYDSCKEQIEAYFGFINVVRDVRMIGVRTSIDVIAYFVYASKENPNEAWSHLDEALCDYLSPQIDRLRKDVIDKVKSAAESKLTDAKIFTKWLDDRQEDLEKISGFLGS